jgi:K+-transporting ATPase ATPase C chain
MRQEFAAQLKAAFLFTLALTVLTGMIYPALVTLGGKAIFPRQTEGSLVMVGGKAMGSSLIGQSFDDPKYFWGRLSATSPIAYNAASSSGSNLGPLNPTLLENAKARIASLKKVDPNNTAPIPMDLVTASGSGLDPHISPEAALYQVARISQARGIDPQKVSILVRQLTEGRTFGILGEKRVNVLKLNLALNELDPKTLH